MDLKREIKGRSKQAGVSHFYLERTFFHSFRFQKRGLHVMLREKPSSLLMLSGWRSVSVASLIRCSLHPYFLARILVS
jgi:hypothetical protein